MVYLIYDISMEFLYLLRIFLVIIDYIYKFVFLYMFSVFKNIYNEIRCFRCEIINKMFKYFYKIFFKECNVNFDFIN